MSIMAVLAFLIITQKPSNKLITSKKKEMNTIKHTVLALAAGLWAAHGVAADRVAPVFP